MKVNVKSIREYLAAYFYLHVMAQSWYPPHPTFLPKNSGPIGREFKTKLEFKQWSHWAHQPTNQRRQVLRGTIGPKSCDSQPPLSAVGGAQRGGLGVTTFRPNGPTVLVL